MFYKDDALKMVRIFNTRISKEERIAQDGGDGN